jgi:RND family efflux transporter MFP subunit
LRVWLRRSNIATRLTHEVESPANEDNFTVSTIQGDRAMSLDKHSVLATDSNATVPSRHTAVHGSEQLKDEPHVSRGGLLFVVAIVLLILVAIAAYGMAHRKHESSELASYSKANSAPAVSLQTPTLQQSAREVVLPGNMQALSQAAIYARSAGYVKAWYHDIGTHVSKGELLALIETPELDQQLAAAKADLATAESNASLAKTTSDRYQDLIGKNAVSQQDTDSAAMQLQARNTQVTSAQANVRRLEELQSFQRITAPFDGVITARNLDVGQLISAAGATSTAGAGSITASKEIFDISDTRRLRVFVNVPQIYSPDAKNGVKATLTLPQYPGRSFEGTLVRSSNAIDPATRTLLAEVDVDNKSGELLPGSYTEVHLHTANGAPALIVPVSALILLPDGLRVATVDSKNIVHLAGVTAGRDTGTTVEILSGLKPGQAVISNPPDSLAEGQKVRVVTVAKGGSKGGGVSE